MISIEDPIDVLYSTDENQLPDIATILTISTFPTRNISLESLINSDIDYNLRYGYYADLKVLEQKEILFNNKTAYKIVYLADSDMPNESKTMRLFTTHKDNFYIVNIFASSSFYEKYRSIFENILNSITFK